MTPQFRFLPAAAGTLALLLTATAYAAAEAAADPIELNNVKRIAFVFDPNDQPAAIYADIRRTADRACQQFGVRTLREKIAERECASALVKTVVARIGRADLAAVHTGTAGS